MSNYFSRAVSKLKSFHLLKIDGNQIAERGVEEIRGVIMRAGKLLGGILRRISIYIYF